MDVVPMMQQLVCVVCVWQLLLGGIIVTGFRRPTSQYNVQYSTTTDSPIGDRSIGDGD